MSTNKINIEAVNARQGLQREEKGLTKQQIPSVEERVQEFKEKQTKIEPDGFLADVGEEYEAVDFNVSVMEDWLTQALTAEREAGREEERANIPVSFLRQWINEDRKQPHQELVTNEDIMRFINIGYGK